MLDEPTNHLDIHSVELLIQALNKYEGSLILVSHDRYFISKTANKIWEIDDHQIKEFKGGYEEWVAWKERMAKAEEAIKKAEAKAPKKQKLPVQKSKEKEPPANQKKNDDPSVNKSQVKSELQKQQKQFQQIEEKVKQLTEKKVQLESALGDKEIYSDKNKFLQTETDYKKVTADLAAANKQYEEVFEKIMDLETKL
jgi:ATP-binding cassette subfamily F protein 3